jgi:hypothetical protein
VSVSNQFLGNTKQGLTGFPVNFKGCPNKFDASY